jgi:hypothetical protein
MKHLRECPLGIGTIVRMITKKRLPSGKMYDCPFYGNKRDNEVYTIIGIMRDPSSQGGWSVKAQSETGRMNPWMSVLWYAEK